MERHLEASDIFVFCLTNGELPNSSTGKLRYVRNKELIENLSNNGVKKENIFFLSNDLPPNDQLLHEFFMTIIKNLQMLLERLDTPDLILTTAAEGGHPDHDGQILVSSSLGDFPKLQPWNFICIHDLRVGFPLIWVDQK